MFEKPTNCFKKSLERTRTHQNAREPNKGELFIFHVNSQDQILADKVLARPSNKFKDHARS